MAKPKFIYLVVQQGGSSREFYVHTFDTVAYAEAYREECDGAAYNTSAVHQIPIAFEKHLAIVEDLLNEAAQMVC